MANYIILEIQADSYNGNVWGPYEDKVEALKDAKKLAEDFADFPDGHLTYKVRLITKVR